MKKVFMMLCTTLFVALSVSAAELTLQNLPQKAQNFIHEYFAKDQIRKIHQHRHRHGDTYNVLFTQ